MTNERRATSRPVIIGILMSLLIGVTGMALATRFERISAENFWGVAVTFMGMGLVGSFWWWRAKGSWSLAFILLINILTIIFPLAFALFALAIVRAGSFLLLMLFLSPIMFPLMFIGAKLGYRARDYIGYRWGG